MKTATHTRQLISAEELTSGRRDPVSKFIARCACRFLKIYRINDLYDKTYDSGSLCAQHLLELLEVKVEVNNGHLRNIPAKGGCVIVSNHPTGPLDGVMLISLISPVRPDVKFMGNFLLERIESLREFFIPVDPFGSGPSNVRGLRAAADHVAQGGALVIFPAGEVATWYNKWNRPEDKAWSGSIIKFLRRLNVPLVPLHITARNSRLFHLCGMIHPKLRTAMLPREFANKQGHSVTVRIGSALSCAAVSTLTNNNDLGKYLRYNIDIMAPIKYRPARTGKRVPATIDDEVPATDIAEELDGLGMEHLLVDHGPYRVFLAPVNKIPVAFRQISILREKTFRRAGEGSLNSTDSDRFDEYYLHLLLWHRDKKKIIGAYRIGEGDAIMERYGLRGFYADTLFRLSDGIADTMRQSVELGRSFVVEEYQRHILPLMLLWRGVYTFLQISGRYRYIIGPVSVSSAYSDRSRSLLISYLGASHKDYTRSRYVTPVHGVHGAVASPGITQIAELCNITLLDKLVRDAEGGARGIPVLVKKYLSAGSKTLGFNTDPLFQDALDVLMILEVKDIPRSVLDIVLRTATSGQE